MKFKDLKPGLPVRLVTDHKSGYGGRGGIVLNVGTFELITGENRTGALVDIGEPCLLVVEPEGLEIVDLDPPNLGWEEFHI